MSFLFWLSTITTLVTLLVHALNFAGRQFKLPVLEFYGRSIASFIALLICATYGTIASAILSVAGYGGLGQYTTARAFKWTMLLFTGVWFDVQDENDYLSKTRPAVLVGNHQTELDVLVLGHIFPPYCSVTAKASLKYWPFLGWFMALSKTVFIERKSRAQAFAAFDNAAKQMQSARQSVYIFPEGTRSYYDHPDLLPFKKGAFHLAIQAQVPIIPVVVANYSNVLNVKRKTFRPGVVPVKVLEPISTKGKTKEDVDSILEEVREKMLKELKALHEQAQKSGVAVKKEAISGSHSTAKENGKVDVSERKVMNAAA
ncbi:Putative phospholipid/glycerol acyltransferase [Septoria linicola]|uniref:1-acyl-sn-glycerol-3-phosphate acyltransferase n=1 Tax=Septoria linicola TaxID=215465 RepID=A0A9Q9AU52_9PEZI|nr:Putative phospholipid/glycerol acyltransferase [Septoria linicola]